MPTENRSNPRNRQPKVEDPGTEMVDAVEAYVAAADWLGPEHAVLVASLRRMAKACDQWPDLVTAHREVATISRQLNRDKPVVEEETEVSALASILEEAGKLRSV